MTEEQKNLSNELKKIQINQLHTAVIDVTTNFFVSKLLLLIFNVALCN